MEPFGILIKTLSDVLSKRANNHVRKEGLTFTQMSVLIYLDRRQGKSAAMTDIQERFSVSQPTVVGITHRLVDKGMVRLDRDPQHPRGKRVWLTPLGQEKCGTAYYRHLEEMEAAILSRMDEKDRDDFQQLLIKAIDGVSDSEK